VLFFEVRLGTFMVIDNTIIVNRNYTDDSSRMSNCYNETMQLLLKCVSPLTALYRVFYTYEYIIRTIP